MSYGLPYQGSKSRIAKWIIDSLPSAETFVDLMAGGCAVSHAAILSGKYNRVVINDIGPGPEIFYEAMKGEFERYSLVASRDYFLQTNDPVVKLLYSFGNDSTTYAYGKEAEVVKVPAMQMLSAPTMHERRMHYKEFIHALYDYLKSGKAEDLQKKLIGDNKSSGGVLSLQSLEALERIQRVEGSVEEAQEDNTNFKIDIKNSDYRLVDIPEGAVIYCDPPYKHAKNSKRYTGNDFNYAAFEHWLQVVPYQVYVSEVTPPAGCAQIGEIERESSMAANTSGKVIEKLFTQERFMEKDIKRKE